MLVRRGYLETRGATLVGSTRLTESRDARKTSLQPETLDMLWTKHGQALEDLWQTQFGHEIGCLMEVEAQNLCRQQSVAAIEDFLAQAASQARGCGPEPAIE